jgi:MFS family permease
VAVANPAIQSHLHASLAGIQWVTNAYLLALAVSLIAIGKADDRFGHKKVFLTGVTGFAGASAAIGLSGTSPPASAWSSRSARCRACSAPRSSRPPWP